MPASVNRQSIFIPSCNLALACPFTGIDIKVPDSLKLSGISNTGLDVRSAQTAKTVIRLFQFHGSPGTAAGQPRRPRSTTCATGRLRATGRSTVGSLVLAPEAETHPRPDWRETKVWPV